MAIRRLSEGLQPWLVPYAEYAFQLMQHYYGVTPTLTSTYRTIQEQQQLYDKRASNPYPVNRPGDSAHNWGLAFDSDVPDAYMPAWIYIRQAVGFRVPENDEVHAEVPNWRSLIPANLRKQYGIAA